MYEGFDNADIDERIERMGLHKEYAIQLKHQISCKVEELYEVDEKYKKIIKSLTDYTKEFISGMVNDINEINNEAAEYDDLENMVIPNL